jgi:thiosulfate reductase/polysulfide reductase chain A
MMIPDKRGEKHAAVKPDATAEAGLEEPRFDQLDTYPLGHKSGVYARMFTNLLDGTGPHEPAMLMCVFQNPVMSVPGGGNVAVALGRLETLVVVDTMLSETAMLADYVLPGTTYLERYDLNSHCVAWPVLGLRQPVVEPLFGQPTEYEIVAELGRQLELRDAEGRDFFRVGPLSGQPIEDVTAWYEDYLSNELKKGAPGLTLDELRALPGAVWVDPNGARYQKYAAPVAPDKLATAWFSGDPSADGTQIYDKPKEEGGARIGTVIDGQALRGFFTKSGKVEFSAPSLADKPDADGRPVDPLPVFNPRDWQPDEQYPLFRINWKEASHTHTRTQNNPWLLEIKRDNPLVVHPATAERFGFGDGDEVVVESPYGQVRARARVSRRIHPEVVGLQHGSGHTALGREAEGRGTRDGLLRPTKADALSGMSLHKEACVTLRPA